MSAVLHCFASLQLPALGHFLLISLCVRQTTEAEIGYVDHFCLRFYLCSVLLAPVWPLSLFFAHILLVLAGFWAALDRISVHPVASVNHLSP